MKLSTEQRAGLEHRPNRITPPSDHALHAARNGWYVFPLIGNGKRPLLKDWENVATTDQAIIQQWFDRWPDANYGIACGPSGVMVVDLDVKPLKDGTPQEGIRNWRELVAGFDLAPTLEVDTPSGGKHLYWRATGIRNSAGRVAPGVDIRGEGGFVVGPGSRIDGVVYTVVGVS